MNTEPQTDLPGGIIRVKVPLPFSLKWVNSYLIADAKGFTLIDPGLHTPEALEAWELALKTHRLGCGDIHTVLLTHQHPDHYGLAGWFQQRTGAPVLISRQAYGYASRMWGQDRSFAAELTGLYARHGMPASELAGIEAHNESFLAKVSPQPDVTFIEAGETLQIGEREWVAIDAPGHARGQLCLYAQEPRWMFCGDQVLADITPNIGIVPGEGDDPLQEFMDSLVQLRGYEVELALPGHRDPLTRFAERIDELLSHHERRLDKMTGLLKETPCTGYEMCGRLFGPRIAGDIHNLRFAMSETLAHLFHLEKRGLAASADAGGVVVFTA